MTKVWDAEHGTPPMVEDAELDSSLVTFTASVARYDRTTTMK
jgi:hypothetical protein